jgi:hypothetical protein
MGVMVLLIIKKSSDGRNGTVNKKMMGTIVSTACLDLNFFELF